MLCLKKVYTDELLQLAILLSILRSEHNTDLIQIPAIGIGDGDSWDFGRSLIRRDTSLHPKNPDAMMLRDEELLADLHNLGRYSRMSSLWQDVTAYMGLTSNGALPSTSSSPQSSPLEIDDHLWDTPVHLKDDSLSQEDMDLIEILWKQDVDMGFSIEGWDQNNQTQSSRELLKEDVDPKSALKNETIEQEESKEEESENKDVKVEDQWAGKQYTIDLETGEYILKEEESSNSSVELDDDEPPSSLLPDPGFSLEEALELVGLNDGFEDLLERAEGGEDETKDLLDEAAVSELEAASSDLQEQLDIIADMIQTPTYHPRPYQGRVGYSRGMSMEQRWQDLASLLSLPPEQQYGHHHLHSAHPPPLHLPPGYHPPPAPLDHPTKTAPSAGATPESPHHYAANLAGSNNVGSAVASSMNLMTNSSEPMGGEAPPVTNFKMENPHDMMYYQQTQQQQQNSSSDIPHNSTEGFLSSILNDEDLQLVENIAWNEGMYTMRMLEGASGGANGGADSDSAVSSMGSERVPSLTSDTECEWTETNSDSGHTPADHYPSDYTASAFSKYKWYDYGYGSRNLSGESSSRGVAQKKHHMYGKRVCHEQSPGSLSNASCGATGPLKMDLAGAAAAPLTPHGSPYASPPLELPRTPTAPELKYSCSVEFSRQNLAQHVDAFIGARSTPSQIAAHNHTYHMLPESCGSHQRPLARDKKGRKTEEEQHLTRDERRARALNIPMLVEDIINLPMDEFNERLSKYDLSENQLSLIRDIRRRGKNKVAAQNCRKRKLDQILTLADEVRQMKDRKARLIHERQVLLSDRHRIKSKFAQLYRHIFQSLRDADGNPYSPYEWSLQQTADGSVILVPRGNQTMLEPDMPPGTQRKPQDHRNP
uniref:BZIP domain-containing protein n=1 Tax=Lygus hesperus TaxID=30085 RepID=A0A0K8SR44_LYGHE